MTEPNLRNALPERPITRAVLLIAVFAGLTGCSQEAPRETPGSPAAAPAAPSAGPRLVVTNEAGGDLSIIDLASRQVVATVPVGKRPRGIRLSPDGATLYVALSGSPIAPPGVDEDTLPPADTSADGIGVVDVREMTLLRVLPSGSDPEQLAVSLDGRVLFIANEDAAQVSVVSAADGRLLKTLAVGGEPEGVDLRPDGKVVYVTCEEDNSVSAIDAETHTVIKEIPVGPRPRSTAFLPDSSRAYVSAENDGTVHVIDAMTHEPLGVVQLEGEMVRPMGVVAAPDGTAIYVTTGRGRRVFIIDPATSAVTGSIEVGERPWGIAVSPDGGTLYTANGPSNDVSIVDVASRRVTARVAVGDRPGGGVYLLCVSGGPPAGAPHDPSDRRGRLLQAAGGATLALTGPSWSIAARRAGRPCTPRRPSPPPRRSTGRRCRRAGCP
jgi:YVTN family beta-propeller protein